MEIKTTNENVTISLEVMPRSKVDKWLRLEFKNSIASQFAYLNRTQAQVMVNELIRLLEQM